MVERKPEIRSVDSYADFSPRGNDYNKLPGSVRVFIDKAYFIVGSANEEMGKRGLNANNLPRTLLKLRNILLLSRADLVSLISNAVKSGEINNFNLDPLNQIIIEMEEKHNTFLQELSNIGTMNNNIKQ